MLIANNLSFYREGKEIFKNLDISLPPKKIVHIRGRNGIGKTTLIKILVNMLNKSTEDENIFQELENTKEFDSTNYKGTFRIGNKTRT